MLDEGRKLVDAARAEGITLRLLGGLAVREHCRTYELCERDYSDLDMVALVRQARLLPAVFAGFGFAEDYEVYSATAGAQMQFVRPCAHGAGPGMGVAHEEDHVDIFLGSVRMDHDIALSKRLEIEPYTVSISDLVLSKLQIFRLTEKDVRDLVTLLGDHDVGDEDAPGVVAGPLHRRAVRRRLGTLLRRRRQSRAGGRARHRLCLERRAAGARASRRRAPDRRDRRRAQDAWAGGCAPASARARPGTTRWKIRTDAGSPTHEKPAVSANQVCVTDHLDPRPAREAHTQHSRVDAEVTS